MNNISNSTLKYFFGGMWLKIEFKFKNKKIHYKVQIVICNIKGNCH